MQIFTDDEIVKMCKEVIESVTVKTEDTYNMSVYTLDTLLSYASSEFQRACVHAAYNKIWSPETKTCFCLFE